MRTIAELMSADVVTISPTDVVATARRTMHRTGLHSLPVVDDDGALVGLLTARQLVDAWPHDSLIKHVMTERPATISPFTSITDAAQIMVDHRLHHLVVVDRDRVQGVVSAWDFLCLYLVERKAHEPAEASPSSLHAEPGDVIVVQPADGEDNRRATVIEVEGANGTAPFVVRWADDTGDGAPRLMLFFPGADISVERGPRLDPATSRP